MRYTAFSRDPAAGNPAGVMISSRLLAEQDMQRIAAEVGFSETAFVAPRADGDGYDVRYFSPAAEVPFCGHATIATAVAMAERDPTLEHVRLSTRSDVVPVAVRRGTDGVTATLTAPPASHGPVLDRVLDETLGIFGWDRGVLDPRLPTSVASAGANHLVLPVATRRTLAGMAYDFEALRAVMLRETWTTVSVVHRAAPAVFHARNAFAVGGVVEDPATGAAAAALGGYLRDAGLLTAPARVTIHQGEDMGRPSLLLVDVPPAPGGIQVTGSAVRIPVVSS